MNKSVPWLNVDYLAGVSVRADVRVMNGNIPYIGHGNFSYIHFYDHESSADFLAHCSI